MRKVMVIGALAAMLAGAGVAAQQPPAQGSAPAQKTMGFKSQAEMQALRAVVQATTPDARIQAADEFVTKFPDSDYRALALSAEAQAYQQKNDYDNMVIYGERALQANPDPGTKLQTQLMLARGIAQRTREFDLDREEKLGRAEKYANSVLDQLKTMPKPNPALPDERWNSVKADMMADAHDTLGIADWVRKNYAGAETEFKTAISTASHPDPTTQIRLADTYNREKKYDEAIAVCDKLMAEPNLDPAIRTRAQAERALAFQKKGGAPAGPAAQPAAPAAPSAQPAPAAPAPQAPSPAPAPKP